MVYTKVINHEQVYVKNTRSTRYLTVEATAYTAYDEGMSGQGITATGIKVHPGIVAVDPRVIPLGSVVYIEGMGKFLAADTGGAIKGNKIDIYMTSRKEALKFGRRQVKVYILKGDEHGKLP